MSLIDRIKQLESKVTSTAPEHHIDLDQCIARLGLDPAAVREAAQSKHSSLVEVICEKLGVEPSEFKRQLQEKADL